MYPKQYKASLISTQITAALSHIHVELHLQINAWSKSKTIANPPFNNYSGQIGVHHFSVEKERIISILSLYWQQDFWF